MYDGRNIQISAKNHMLEEKPSAKSHKNHQTSYTFFIRGHCQSMYLPSSPLISNFKPNKTFVEKNSPQFVFFNTGFTFHCLTVAQFVIITTKVKILHEVSA